MNRHTPIDLLATLRRCTALALAGVLGLALSASVAAQSQQLIAPSPESLTRGVEVELPAELEELRIDQRLGQRAPLDVRLRNHEGSEVELGGFFGDRPVLLAPVYYDCPMLCSLVLDGVVRSLKPLSLLPGRDFEVLAVSFDPRDTPLKAAESRTTALQRYRRAEAEPGWHFLVGEEAEVARLMDAVGFRYRFDPTSGEYAHAGAVILLTPEGEVARYFYGVEYPPKDIRLGLVEASQGRIGSVVDQVMLFCYRYDPALGRYSAVTMNVVRLGGVVTVLAIATFVSLMLWRERRRRALA
jgi:protein SCO1